MSDPTFALDTGIVFMHVIWTKTHRKELQTKLREAS